MWTRNVCSPRKRFLREVDRLAGDTKTVSQLLKTLRSTSTKVAKYPDSTLYPCSVPLASTVVLLPVAGTKIRLIECGGSKTSWRGGGDTSDFFVFPVNRSLSCCVFSACLWTLQKASFHYLLNDVFTSQLNDGSNFLYFHQRNAQNRANSYYGSSIAIFSRPFQHL